jgi:hypothetical protein
MAVKMADVSTTTTLESRTPVTPKRVSGWISLTIILTSVLLCVMIGFSRSAGLIGITVTALDANVEPRDHGLPLIKKHEALPDYEIIVLLHDGHRINLGAKPDKSAVKGLEWKLNDPVSITDIATIRLQDQDTVVSDAIVEVQITDQPVNEGNYRFNFHTERLVSIGVQSFFHTPIGKAIAAAFFVAVLVMLASVLSA